MASKAARVVLRGRFREGDVVSLFEVADERVLRVEAGAKLVDLKRVGPDGVSFTSGVRAGVRYIARGMSAGVPVEVRVRGAVEGEESSVLVQPPVGAERTRRADGSWDDEPVVVAGREVDAAGEVVRPARKPRKKAAKSSAKKS